MNTIPPIGSNWDDLERIRTRQKADSGRLKPIQTAPNLPPSPHRQSQTPHG